MNPAVQAAQAVIAVKPVGMTPTAYIMLVFVVVSVPLLAGILRQLIKNQPEMRKLDNEESSNLLNHAMTRIDTLEKSQVEERRQCDEKLKAMQAQIDGLTRQLVAFQISSGRPMQFSPEATASADRVMAHIERKEKEA